MVMMRHMMIRRPRLCGMSMRMIMPTGSVSQV
ncbi:MAG: hypothetical protein RLZZ387_4125 [Chloroflexota bacterium]|jgi:hypothetical protein